MKRASLTKRLLALALSVVLLAQGAGALAAEEQGGNLIPEAPSGLLEEQLPQGGGTLIVLLEEESLVETAVRGGQTSKEFFDVTQEGQSGLIEESQGKLLEQQQELQQEIRGSIAPEMTLEYSYTAALNGFAIEVADVAVKEEIAALPGVKYVAVAGEYAPPAPVEGDTRASLTEENMLVLPGYEGEGRVVAVIDSGLDTEHEFFQTAPQNIAYTREEIQDYIKVINQTKTAEKKITSGAWRSDKIPFAWGYGESTENTLLSDDIASHGTHVAGIATGVQGAHPTEAGKTFNGVAPQAQLVFFAVANKEDDIMKEEAILAAMDDTAKLGVDAVNCSFGRDYESVGMAKPEAQAVANMRAAGIQVVVAAGNESKGLEGASTPPTQVEYGTGGVPTGIASSFSVASAEAMVRFDHMLETASGDRLAYFDGRQGTDFYDVNQESTAPVVYCGSGQPQELEQVKDLLPGAIAMVNDTNEFRTEPFEEAVREAGADSVLIWITDSLAPDNYNFGVKLPYAFIGKEEGETLLSLAPEADALGQLTTITMVPGLIKRENPKEAEDPLSDFTSWGTNERLELKPDIAAPGGAIHSSVPDGTHEGYATMSGTSMASPQMAGLQALLSEWFEKDSGLTDADLASWGFDRPSYFKCLIMSTAEVYTQESGVPYSPRRQGAGQVNPLGVLSSNAFLLGESAVGSKEQAARIELGEIDKSGAFTAGFTIQVIDSTALESYKNATVTAEFFRNNVDSETQRISGSSVALAADYEVELGTPKGNAIPVTVRVQLDQEELEEILATFTNGFFVDGYLTVTPAQEETVLHLPVMGFYHVWAQAPIFDHSAYTEEHYTVGSRIMSTTKLEDNIEAVLVGADSKKNLVDRQKFVAISPNGDGTMDALMVDSQLLRGAQVQWTLERQGIKVLTTDSTQTSKYGASNPLAFPERGLEQLPEGAYQLSAQGELPYGEEGDPARVHTFAGDTGEEALSVFIDKTAPTARFWVEEADGKTMLYAGMQDNHYVKEMQLCREEVEYSPEVWAVQDVDRKIPTFSLDVTGYTQERLSLIAVDHAGNEGNYALDFAAANAPFTDVSVGDWYYEGVREVYISYLFGGVSKELFAPYTSMTRAMAVTVLHRAMGTPEPSSLTLPFTDVNPKAYYYKALCWAQEQGIAGGISPTLFDPEGILAREQLAAILYRTMGSPAVTGDLSAFPDGDTVSAYAKNAMLWATQNKIILGDQGMLLPKAFTNRAQVAVMIDRLFRIIL